MKPNRLFWTWGYDGTVVRVQYVYYTRFLKRPKTKTMATFFSRDFDDVVKVAEDYIKRTTEEQEGE